MVSIRLSCNFALSRSVVWKLFNVYFKSVSNGLVTKIQFWASCNTVSIWHLMIWITPSTLSWIQRWRAGQLKGITLCILYLLYVLLHKYQEIIIIACPFQIFRYFLMELFVIRKRIYGEKINFMLRSESKYNCLKGVFFSAKSCSLE